MKKPTKAQIARLTRLQPVIAAIAINLGQDHADALGSYAAYHGNDWATQLLDDWYSGRDAAFRHPHTGAHLGHFLRQIRNHPKHGPAFYAAYHGE